MLEQGRIDLSGARGAARREGLAGGGTALGRRLQWLALLTGLIALAFGKPLVELTRLAFEHDLYSYVLLVPFISLYLVWWRRQEWTRESVAAPWLAVGPVTGGLVLVGAFWLAVGFGWQPARQDYLSLMSLAFLLCFLGICLGLLGAKTLRTLAFPAGFLIFMVPFPVVVEHGFEAFLQHASAEASYLLLKLSGTTMFREGTLFVLPGITLEVAPECSGVRSSLVLFITSLLAGYLFLRGRWARTALAVAVIPLGILRNAVRILVLAQLCIHINPDMIDSSLHRRGGPVFFVISLVPLFLLLVWMRRRERRMIKPKPSID
jgi:exosortase C (VPDSG-CTERM-specific)